MESLLARLQRALAGRYTVEHELGRGGMAVVYLGQDQRLERRVAIKVFEREGGLISAGERFLREIQVAAKLQHPNILPVFESGDGEGLVYYVMPYVAGGSVRERLEREGPLPVADAVRIAREVAEALDHAHRAGIVHRDIKPDNIMLADGVAVVADFGIARAIEQGGGKVTDTGLAIGTPTYMSPEQAAASPQIDGRTDIYALGCVLYEMLAGTPPFSGTTAQQVMARHATDTAPPLSTVRRVPPALEAALQRALAKLPGDRWPTGRAMAEALNASVTTPSGTQPVTRGPRRTVLVTGVVGLLVLGALTIAKLVTVKLVTVKSAAEATASAAPQRVAVLPFSSAGDTSYALFADGLTEGVSTGLIRVEGLSILSGGKLEAYRDQAADPQEVGRALNVSAVVYAVLRGTGNQFRVTARLVDVATGRSLWQQQFDGELVESGRLHPDMFAIQDAIAGKIVDALLPRLSPVQRANLARGVRTRDPRAYALWLQARELPATKAGTNQAIALLHEAIKRDSTFADAWAELAIWYFWLYSSTNTPPAELALSWRQAIDHALDLDSRNASAYRARGMLRILYEWDLEGGRLDLRRAVQLNPSSADLNSDLAIFLPFVAQPDSALSYARRGVVLDTTSAFAWNLLGKVFAFGGMRDSAIAASERSLALDSTMWHTNWVLMNAYLDAGRRADADRAVARLLQYGEDRAGALAFAATYYRRAGNLAAAREILSRITARSRLHVVQAASWGAVKLAVGDRAGALDALEQAARERDLDLLDNLVLNYAPLRSDPRFIAISRRVYRDKPLPQAPFP